MPTLQQVFNADPTLPGSDDGANLQDETGK
jgi:hypothetical protein